VIVCGRTVCQVAHRNKHIKKQLSRQLQDLPMSQHGIVTSNRLARSISAAASGAVWRVQTCAAMKVNMTSVLFLSYTTREELVKKNGSPLFGRPMLTRGTMTWSRRSTSF